METQPADPALYLASGHYVDSDSTAVRDFTARALAPLGADADMTQRAIRLFDAVRDGLRYDPYSFSPDPERYRASVIAGDEAGFCVPKAILLAAVLRSAGIPAALGFADVRNHLNTPKLSEMMGTDLFVYHGYVQLWLGGESFKVTPAFNMELCARFGVKPLIFDGTGDALFHEYDAAERRHMEYVRDRGLFVDFPAEAFMACFRETYPKLAELNAGGRSAENDPGFMRR
ncbi:MAG: transglutaminase family protein [Paracoccaceae bacterium]